MKADKANKIQQYNQMKIGNSPFVLQLELKKLIATIRLLICKIGEIQNQINSILDEFDSPIISIRGIGKRLGATILTENINYFKNPSQLQVQSVF